MKNVEKIFLTAFSSLNSDGGGWVTKKILKWHNFYYALTRTNSFFEKACWSVMGVLFLPFLHPIFTRFVPIFFLVKNREKQIWLNFSQTFGGALFGRNCVLICHDLQCHRKFRFKKWARWSEKLLLNRASSIHVLSLRDQRLIRRYYAIPINRVKNIGPKLMEGMEPFHHRLEGPVKKVIFLGSLIRPENREGIIWFIHNVLPFCPDLEIQLIGKIDPSSALYHPQLNQLGFVENLNSVFAQADLMIAPMFSEAGIKIKVIEALMQKMPVLGTRAAYSGLPLPSKMFCSNDPLSWIALLNKGEDFSFPAACQSNFPVSKHNGEY